MRIKWSKSDGGENWASINGYVDGRLRFHIVGERFGGKVNGWDLHDFKATIQLAPRERLGDAKNVAQAIIDVEEVRADLERNNHA